MAYDIKTRTRTDVKRDWYHDEGVEIWLDCIGCAQSIGLAVSLKGGRPGALRFMTDDEARSIFAQHGWTIRPTRCPACAKAATSDA